MPFSVFALAVDRFVTISLVRFGCLSLDCVGRCAFLTGENAFLLSADVMM